MELDYMMYEVLLTLKLHDPVISINSKRNKHTKTKSLLSAQCPSLQTSETAIANLEEWCYTVFFFILYCSELISCEDGGEI